MAFEPNNITKEHVLAAVAKVEKNDYQLAPSIKYDVVINGKHYPPKEIMRHAHEEMNGEYLWELSGGEPTHKYLIAMGFQIVEKGNDPVRELINAYKLKVRSKGNDDEKYKWQLGRQFRDVWGSDIPFNDKVYQFNFANLLYYNAIVVLKQVTDAHPDIVEGMFQQLFNESQPLQDRIDKFRDRFKDVYAQMYDGKYGTHQDGRSIATYLAFYNPEKYTYFKDSFYRKYCKLLGIKHEKPGKKYPHYLSLVNSFIDEYITNDSELLELKASFIDDSCDPDTNNLILAQDILYQTLDLGLASQKNYWRIGTKEGEDNGTSKWNKMVTGGYAAIGWPEIGNLEEQDDISRDVIYELLKDEGYYPNDNRTASRKAGEILAFYESIKIGDVIVAQDGQEVLGIGIVLDDYEHISDDSFAHIRRVDWEVKSTDLTNLEGLRTTIYPLYDKDFISKVNALLSNPNITQPDTVQDKNQTTMDLNTILYGPPGTGKTYNSIYHALSIIEGKTIKELKNEVYDDIKRRFDELLIKDIKDEPQKGRIGFITFHQSLSYEDFIEGIKPILSDGSDGEINYTVKAGIFKYLCTIAKIGPETIHNPDFDRSYEALINYIKEQDDEKVVLNTLKQEKPFTIYVNSNNNLRHHANTEKAYEGVIKKEVVKAYLETGIAPDWASYTSAVGEFMRTQFGYNSTSKDTTDQTKPYVLIIDEINRGNVSQIFGELITLIEKNKRLGKKESLGVILPYSNEFFTVPSNLYIVGTMNTADRSVEALDTALRRRFIFKEMMPEPDLLKKNYVDGISLESLLKRINERIADLLDDDHQIGHSYFLNVDNPEGLKTKFKDSIIPLLKEYFYNDYEKIQWILGKKFVTNKTSKTRFAKGVSVDFDKDSFEFVPIDDDFDIVDALKDTMNEEQ